MAEIMTDKGLVVGLIEKPAPVKSVAEQPKTVADKPKRGNTASGK